MLMSTNFFKNIMLLQINIINNTPVSFTKPFPHNLRPEAKKERMHIIQYASTLLVYCCSTVIMLGISISPGSWNASRITSCARSPKQRSSVSSFTIFVSMTKHISTPS